MALGLSGLLGAAGGEALRPALDPHDLAIPVASDELRSAAGGKGHELDEGWLLSEHVRHHFDVGPAISEREDVGSQERARPPRSQLAIGVSLGIDVSA
jgi:hypothetical protein